MYIFLNRLLSLPVATRSNGKGETDGEEETGRIVGTRLFHFFRSFAPMFF